ncbi:MAG TPA: F0F1 ATP synthase subunit B [Actinomycetaceae bacterium]|nr:F0F1 ATP synthase subunit B [Actinomycetaceae bacterium]
MELLLPATYDVVWSVVAVLIIAVPFVRVVIPRINSMLDERAEKIEGGIKAGEEARKEAAELRAQFEEQSASARREAAANRDRAIEEGKAIVADYRVKADEEARRLIANANRQITADRQAAEISLRADVGLLASELAARIIGEALTDADMQTRVIDRFLDELESEKPAVRVGEGES